MTLRQSVREFLSLASRFPWFVAAYTLGFLKLIVTSVDILSLLIFAVLIGFITTALIGAAAFFGGYVITRSLDSLAEALYRNG